MSSAAASSSKPTKTRRSKKAAPISESSGSETDSSEDVTEDEDGVDLTPALDAAILRTLAKIRNKRGVYEGENVLENELKEAEEKVISAGIKAMPNRREEIKVCIRWRVFGGADSRNIL
jgi:protein KRI1